MNSGIAPYLDRMDWNRIHLFWGDERCVPPNDPESNFGMARDVLISKIPIPPGHIHRMRGELQDPAEAAAQYETEIRNTMRDPAFLSFGLVLLGMGEDGHTASLFPGKSWTIKARSGDPGTEDRLKTHFNDSTLLNEAQSTLFLITGLNKANTLAKSWEMPPAICPPRGSIPSTAGSYGWWIKPPQN